MYKHYKIYFYLNGKISQEFGINESGDGPFYFYREYFEDGKLKMDIPKKDKNDPINLGNTLFYYDENGNIIRIEEYKKKVLTKTLSTIKDIGEYIITQNFNEYSAIFVIKKVGLNRSTNKYESIEEYPKGEDLYKKSLKLLEDIKDRFNKAGSDELRSQFINEYKLAVNKLIEISKADTNAINEQISKVRKIEDIKRVLGI